ncbi:MAG TPA: hypothetical protein VFB22_05850 [Candidatus Baltobacteraceae bacterium]|nr:hypothetical protein [Candidatus Baltobacteraceae bacterium]
MKKETRLETLRETMVHEFAHVVVARVGGLSTNYIEVHAADNAVSHISGIIDPATGGLNQTRLPLIARIAVAGVSGEALLRTDDPAPTEIVETLRAHNRTGDPYYIDVQNLEKALGAPLAGAVPETLALIHEAVADLKPRM